MDEKAENTRLLLIAQMKRAIELLEDDEITSKDVKREHPWTADRDYYISNPNLPELSNKLHEIRRDSVRFMKNIGYGK